MLDEYYKARGWGKDGLQTKETLLKLDLEDIANELEGLGKLSNKKK